jgi:hypothetical protein
MDAGALVRRTLLAAGGIDCSLALHADNGSAQKVTLIATRQALGIAPSRSRPRRVPNSHLQAPTRLPRRLLRGAIGSLVYTARI